MKILQLTVHFPPNIGGVETHIEDLVEGLVKKGNSIFVLTYRPLVVRNSWKILEKKKDLTILRLPWVPGFFYQFVHNPIIEFLYLTPGLFISLPFVLFLYRPQVIHAHGIVAGFVGVFWGNLLRKRIIISTHSLYHFPSHGMYYIFAKWIFSNSSFVLCLSDQSVEEIKRLGIEQLKIKRFIYWIDTEKFAPMNKEVIKKELDWEGKFVVLFIGRLVPEKGVRELLIASNKISDTVKIVVAGSGPLESEVEKYAKNNTRLIFLHALNNDVLPKYYNAADVLIIPSTHDEGFGRVILESLACGTPVIASKRGAIPEAMDKTVGQFISVTPENIVTVITSLEKNKILLQKLQRNTRAFALKRYSENNINEILHTYSSNV